MKLNDKNKQENRKKQSKGLSKALRAGLGKYLSPLLRDLYLKMDRRLVSTLLSLIEVILQHRKQSQGLVLTELGSTLLGEDQAPAGTKRIGNLLKSGAWRTAQVDNFLAWQAQQAYSEEIKKHDSVLVIWDESVLEKAESAKAEALCSVRSAKAKRLLRIRPGFYNPPTAKPVHVPGFQWMGLLVAGITKGVWVHTFIWWTTRGEHARERAGIFEQCLTIAREQLSKAIHVLDRGFCGAPWVGNLLNAKLLFVMRWKQNVKLVDANGIEQTAGQFGKRLRSKSRRLIWDSHKMRQFEAGMAYMPIRHPAYTQPLFLVICRPGKKRKPWYLLTNCTITQDEQAWRVIFCYARRWQIELVYRFTKTELAIQTLRQKKWAYRLKMMALVTLAYAFLLTLAFDRTLQDTKATLLRLWCHRTGRKYQTAKVPIYRLRWALAALWSKVGKIIQLNPEFLLLQNSG